MNDHPQVTIVVQNFIFYNKNKLIYLNEKYMIYL